MGQPNHQDVRASIRPKHLEFLSRHAPLLLACGAKLNDDGTDQGGGLYVIDVAERADAERFIAEDPFNHSETFDRVTITRWRKVYVGGQLLG
jgi:uncharacterized protein YciI